jgi:hypothetical protein
VDLEVQLPLWYQSAPILGCFLLPEKVAAKSAGAKERKKKVEAARTPMQRLRGRFCYRVGDRRCRYLGNDLRFEWEDTMWLVAAFVGLYFVHLLDCEPYC